MSLPTIDTGALNKFFDMLTVEKIIYSILILLVCLLVIKITLKILRRFFDRTDYLDARLEKFIVTAIRTILLLITVIIVAQNLGVPMTSLVALLSVGALAVSLAVQGMLSNVAGGMMLLTSRIISIDDLVEVAGVTGTVSEVGVLYTKLRTADGQLIMLPNSSISTEKITNYSTLGQRRITILIGASYDAAAADVRKALLEAAEGIEGILPDPAPVVYVNAYQESCIEYALYAWANVADYWNARCALNEAAKTALDNYQIEIPYNHLNVHILNDSTLKVQQEK